jgi:hypothetical protein
VRVKRVTMRDIKIHKRGLFIAASIVLAAVLIVAAFLIGERGNVHGPPRAGTSASPKSSSSASPKTSPVTATPRRSLLSALSGQQRKREVAAKVAGLRLVDYYPAANGWTKMWTNWNAKVLGSDFARIHALGGNAVRIIVFPYTFGWPRISSSMAARFANTLQIAAHNELAVQVTLFDWWGSYDQISESQAWLKSLLSPYASDPEIQLVELKNEVDPTDSAEVAWARALLPTLRSVMPRTPSTVSVSGTAGPSGFAQLRAELARSPFDVADIHFYGNELTAYSWMLAAKRAAGPLPLFVGEIGVPSIDTNGAGKAAAAYQQAHWFSVVFAAARAAGVATPAPWTLYDFKPGTIPSAESDSEQYYYGLYSDTGKWRPSVEVVKAAFAGRIIDTSNLNFSLVGENQLPMIWSSDLSGRGDLSYDPKISYLGSDAVGLSETGPCDTGTPSLSMVPTNPAISGQQWTVSVWASGLHVNGMSQMSISWYNAAGSYMGNTVSEPLTHGNPSWTRLTVHARVPPDVTGVKLDLNACGGTGTVWFAHVQISVIP